MVLAQMLQVARVPNHQGRTDQPRESLCAGENILFWIIINLRLSLIRGIIARNLPIPPPVDIVMRANIYSRIGILCVFTQNDPIPMGGGENEISLLPFKPAKPQGRA